MLGQSIITMAQLDIINTVEEMKLYTQLEVNC